MKVLDVLVYYLIIENHMSIAERKYMFVIECPKIYRKSVQHLLKYTANLYADAVQICVKFWDTQ